MAQWFTSVRAVMSATFTLPQRYCGSATRSLGEVIVIKNHLALLLAGSLGTLQVTAGWGNDNTVGLGSSQSPFGGLRSDTGSATVPPGEQMISFIPGSSAIGSQFRMPLLKFETLVYFVVHPIPDAQFCTGPKMTRIWTE
jgi:hypothetical protein